MIRIPSHTRHIPSHTRQQARDHARARFFAVYVEIVPGASAGGAGGAEGASAGASALPASPAGGGLGGSEETGTGFSDLMVMKKLPVSPGSKVAATSVYGPSGSWYSRHAMCGVYASSPA
mmetsp:Transcript_38350/g.59276  ORF Transcript_38350/g.59276 Transcript_38350/m.59276 type:complete len:120 (-) Transcript_38350:887-1246(-)